MNAFQYLNLTDQTFCCLIERSAQIAAVTPPVDGLNAAETAILGRLAQFADFLVPNIASITETPLQGVWTLYFEGNVTRTPLTAIDTSGLLKTVGSYLLCEQGWAVNVRVVA